MPITLTASKPNIRAIQSLAPQALEDVANYVASKAAKYPPQKPGSTYVRTGTLGRSITKTKATRYGNGYRVQVGTNVNYAPAVESGTGVYGPSKAPITPRTAKVLAWTASRGGMKRAGVSGGKMIAMGLGKSKGKFRHSAKHDTMMIFAKSVKGFQGWHFMEKAFNSPQTVAYANARMQKLVGSIVTKFDTSTGAK